MADMEEPPALAHIEKTLADSYRKEIDQEENVWRTLPFFAATIALEITALLQTFDHLPPSATLVGKLADGLLILAGLLILGSLGVLAASIYPQKFVYIAKDTALLGYAQRLIRLEQAIAPQPLSALATLKSALARQYAAGADHNREINKRRERYRSIAGLGAIGSVLVTVLLVGLTRTYHVDASDSQDASHVAAQFKTAATPPIAKPRLDTRGNDRFPAGPSTTPHASGHQGLVDPSGGA